MKRLEHNSKVNVLIALLLLLPITSSAASNPDPDEDRSSDSDTIIRKYLLASQIHVDPLRGASMQVDIDASIPKLKKQGRLRALRKISKVGQITYRVLGFQGDNTVKKEVIARYLSAEQQAQGDEKMAITPANYKFKFKGSKKLQFGGSVYVFALSPRKKQIGLFKGEMWLDPQTLLPVFERGRLVKNPSIFFKKVEFQRAFSIQNGLAVPQHMSSTIDTRLIGKVQIDIDYTNFEPEKQDTDVSASDETSGHEATMASGMASLAR